MSEFVLRAEGKDHTDDIRSLFAPPLSGGVKNITIYTASRDKTARGFSIGSENTNAGFPGTFIPTGFVAHGHQQFVNAVVYADSVPCLEGAMPAIITASNDKHIIAWGVGNSEMEAIFDGHAEGVRSLALVHREGGGLDLVSGGWDKMAIAWCLTTGQIRQIYTDHNFPVLCATQLGTSNSTVVTGGSDKKLHAWSTETGAAINVFEGHKDVVQCVTAIDGQTFASGSNDGSVRLWHVELGPVAVLNGHSSLVLGITTLPTSGEIVSTGEDRSIRIWTPTDGKYKPQQVINCPSSLWCVAATAEGDILAGGSDCSLRAFTRNQDEVAPPELLVAFNEQVSQQTIDYKTVTPQDEIPPESEIGSIKGSTEGERRMFLNEGGTAVLYSWQAGTWERLGDVYAGNGRYNGKQAPREKQQLNGQSYDYVFSVKVGEKSLALPYNRGQSLMDAAMDFVMENKREGVSLDDRGTIVQFLLQNIDKEDAQLAGYDT